MPTKITVPQSANDNGNKKSHLLKDMIENGIKKEKKLFDEINAKFNKKREEALKKFDINEASNYLKKERETFDAFFGRFGENVARLEPMKKALRKEIQKNALKRFPVFRELALINSDNANNLQHGLLANFGLGNHLHGSFSDPEIFLPVDNTFHQVAPPFNLSEDQTNVEGEIFNEDFSFLSAEWGLLGNDVRYKDSNGFFDSGSSFKLATSNVIIGSNFTMPKEGMLEVLVVVSNLDNHITYSASDNFGPSDASFEIFNHLVFFVWSQAGWLFGPDFTAIHVAQRSDGDDISDTIKQIAPGKKFVLRGIVGPIQEGYRLNITVESGFTVYSTLHNMDIDITGTVLWKVEHIYVRVP
jgi:hypothetical protein